jgi:hypothetical protein
MAIRLFTIILLLGASSASAAGQSPSISPGDRVRVWTDEGTRTGQKPAAITGAVKLWSADTILLLADRPPFDREIAVPAVVRIDVSGGRTNRRQSILRNGAIGLAVGSLVGGVIGYLSYPYWEIGAFNAGMQAQLFGVFFGVPGASVGALRGAYHPDESWQQLWAERHEP